MIPVGNAILRSIRSVIFKIVLARRGQVVSIECVTKEDIGKVTRIQTGM